MLEVRFHEFHDSVADRPLKFAIIVSRHNGQWVFCKHKERDTYECPGGHREPNENIDDTAKRELWEETGATHFDLQRICVYSVRDDENETYGMLYYADIYEFGPLPALEIEKVEILNELPFKWTYPLIQPKLIEKVESTHFSGTALGIF